jgi:hypothetical protein
MIEFENILTQLEALASRASAPRATRIFVSSSEVAYPADDQAQGSRRAGARAAYAEHARHEPKDTDQRKRRAAASTPDEAGAASPILPDMKSIVDDVRKAGTSVQELRALRRRFAWSRHPDRLSASDSAPAGGLMAHGLMADVNALIDAAIAEVRAGSSGKKAR